MERDLALHRAAYRRLTGGAGEAAGASAARAVEPEPWTGLRTVTEAGAVDEATFARQVRALRTQERKDLSGRAETAAEPVPEPEEQAPRRVYSLRGPAEETAFGYRKAAELDPFPELRGDATELEDRHWGALSAEADVLQSLMDRLEADARRRPPLPEDEA